MNTGVQLLNHELRKSTASCPRLRRVLEKIARRHQYLYEHTERIGNNGLNEQFAPEIEELSYAYQHVLDIAR